MPHYVAGYYTNDGFEIEGVFPNLALLRASGAAFTLRPPTVQVWNGTTCLDPSLVISSDPELGREQ